MTRVLITGANRGIGLSFAKHYKSTGAEVIAVCRKASPEIKTIADIVIDNIELTNAAHIQKLVGSLGNNQIDILINNAGILRSESLDDFNTETIQQQLLINAIAPIHVCHALLPFLAKNSKVAMITSRMGSIADNGSGGYYGYRMSKAALNAASKSLAIDLKPQGIAVAILHPGFVQTDMVNHAGDISSETAANRLAERIEALDINNTGSFWHSNGELLPW